MEKTLRVAQRGGGSSLVGMSVKGSNLWRKVGLPRRKEGRGGGGVRKTRRSGGSRVCMALAACQRRFAENGRKNSIEVTTYKVAPRPPRAGAFPRPSQPPRQVEAGSGIRVPRRSGRPAASIGLASARRAPPRSSSSAGAPHTATRN